MTLLISAPFSIAGQSTPPANSVSPPVPIFKVDASYPGPARRASIGGTVTFSAAVNPNGSVQSVSVLSVPDNGDGLGFEQAVQRAVLQWRFQPAMRAGIAVAGVYKGDMQFNLVIPGEMIYPVRSAAAWKAVQTLMSELDVDPQTRIRRDRQQFYVGRTDYANRGFPSATELGLPSDLIPGYVQLHISVAAAFEPARVAIGSLISAAAKPELTAPGASPTARARRVHVFYGVAPMAKWIHGRLAALLGVTPEPLSAHGQAERAAQSERLLPGAVPLACRETPPLPADRPRALEDLEIIYRHPLEYSRDMVEAAQQAAGKGTVFSFSGEVTEHGTLAYVQPAALFTSGQKIVQTPQLAEALRVAQQAAHLSRWEPVVIGGCPVSVPVRINVRFDR